MGILKRLFEPKMVAVPDPMVKLLVHFLEEDPSLPRPYRISGGGIEWITEEEAHRREVAAQHMPSLEALLQDRNVAVVVEAAEGLKPAA